MAEPKRQNLKVVGDEQALRGFAEGGEPGGVAGVLRGARLRAGLELRDVADALRIRYPYLQAIEEGRFQELPGPTYALGFVRAYAEFLELDGTEIVRQFKDEGRGLNRRTALVFPEPVQEGRFPGAGMLLVALLLAGAAYGGWYYWQNRQPQVTSGVPPVPAPLATLAPAKPSAGAQPAGEAAAPSAAAPEAEVAEPPPASSDAGPATAVAGNSTASAPDATQPAPVAPAPTGVTKASAVPSAPPALPVATPEAPVPAAPAASEAKPGAAPAAAVAPPKPADTAAASEAPKPEPVVPRGASTAAAAGESAAAPPAAPEQVASVKPSEPHVYGESNTDSRIVLTARQNSWVQVRDKENNVIWTRILRPGDSYRVPSQSGLTLLTGNAGALEVAVDGRPAPALGAPGAVRRNIALDPERLAAGSAGGQ